ncbi:hypothetical protein [Polaribacter sp. MED152]|uniref:hypothetical protein n=1 Tax=Polaribacter sp. MED152 TaxID=313598 RepID=UPI000068CB9B|nr:hypothetical protein [Polaribacter sp. MED152]EAQ41242.1 hypothetical protein MED152_00970 [Polaribacter sp. MED152]
MKNVFATIITFLIFTSCNDSRKLKDLESRISNIENQNKILSDSLKSLNAEFLKPFKAYEKIVLFEFKNSPNEIISDYEYLIKDYPNSFWKHEAKKRIENIKKRKNYWTEKDGWKLPKKPEKTELIKIIEPMVISCPGC